mmetsp:Transcript_1715/g.2337  ORF Transcript_1715/g.2337 Transcript_1715/m.2337 type:complete len:182 (-) Transcript_1715:4-549(-)
MSQRPRRPAVALLVLGTWCLWTASVSFVGPSTLSQARHPKTALQYSIFDGLPNLNPLSDGEEKDGQNPENRYSAREAGDASRVVEVDMPLGVEFEEKEERNIYVKSVDPSSDAFAKGVRPGAQLVMVSATFGDEMWPTREVGMTQLSTVIRSRFGSTMKLALEKEDRNILQSFFEQFQSKG